MRTTLGLTRKALRVFRRGPALVACVCLCFAECILKAALGRPRVQTMQRWSARCLSVMGVEVSLSGPIPASGLIVSNHLSYLDIWVFSAVTRCAFVSKSEVKWWPVVGWVASLAGTVFIDRSRASQTQEVQPQMQAHLKSGQRLVLFPEATSWNGSDVLPFRSSLFESAVTAAAPITAAHLSYEFHDADGDPATDVCYWGDMTLFPHVIKLMTKRGVRAIVKFADEPRVFTNRKQAALELRRQVLELGAASKTKTFNTEEQRTRRDFGELNSKVAHR